MRNTRALSVAAFFTVFAAAVLPYRAAFCETLVLEGFLDGAMRITQVSTFSVQGRVGELRYRFAVPKGQAGKTVTQTVNELTIECDPRPVSLTDEVDGNGNAFKVATWRDVTRDVTVTVRYAAVIRSELSTVVSAAPFPVGPVSGEAAKFLRPTQEVQSGDPLISDIARQLTAGARSQYDAVTAIINYVADAVVYAHNPAQYDALNTLMTNKGNCTNISHAAMALLRSAGIPARMAGGIGLKKKWAVPSGSGGNLVQGFSQGSHAWVEVYYPDVGWLPYDVQQTKNFTSTRHIKKSHGSDRHEIADSWWGTPYLPRYSSHIEERFIDDTVSVRLRSSQKLPRICMLSNEFRSAPSGRYVSDAPSPVTILPPVPEKAGRGPDEWGQIVIGNTEFPSFVDLYTVTGNRATEIYDAETAEYVTSSTIYAQAFELQGPVEVGSVSLALKRFGGDGTAFIDIVDDEAGKPGQKGLRSMPVCLDRLERRRGYDWGNFPVPHDIPAVLDKGKHWIILRHSGEAVVNWFYSPGKRYGGMHDTRSTGKGLNWEDILGYDFVFKVTGRRQVNAAGKDQARGAR